MFQVESSSTNTVLLMHGVFVISDVEFCCFFVTHLKINLHVKTSDLFFAVGESCCMQIWFGVLWSLLLQRSVKHGLLYSILESAEMFDRN